MKIDQSVLAILSASTTNGSVLTLPPTQLDRATYTKVAKTLELVGGKWNRSAQGHVFGGEAADALDSILLTGEVRDLRKEFQAFYTPASVANRVVLDADIQPGMTVLEPSAGHGALAVAAREAGGSVACVEIEESAFAVLTGLGLDVTRKDFCEYEPLTRFDRVVMNPPFAKQQDMIHVLRAFEMLKPGGRLVAIVSPSFRYRDTAVAKAFKSLLSGNPSTIADLPSGSFKESGTSVDTVVVVLDRPA